MSITLVLADDHPLILDGLESLLKAEQDFTVLARCSTGEETVGAVREHNPDIPIGVEKVILKCLDAMPDGRYPFTSVLLRDLQAALYV